MKNIICVFMVMCIVPAFAQFTPSTLQAFKEKMLEKKEYAGVTVNQSTNQISPSDFIGDIEGSSENWSVEFVDDVVKSCYRYAVGNDLVRLYVDVNITTGNVVSLQRNSSGTIYWWSETWKPAYTVKESYKTKTTKLPKRLMNAKEKECINMFATIIQMVTGTFSTGNTGADTLVYKCFAKKEFAQHESFGLWEASIFNDIFFYQFLEESTKDNKEGYLIIEISLLDKKVSETFKYFTVEPMITKEMENGFSIESNPNFDPAKHIVYLPMTGELIPELLETFK